MMLWLSSFAVVVLRKCFGGLGGVYQFWRKEFVFFLYFVLQKKGMVKDVTLDGMCTLLLDVVACRIVSIASEL